MAVDVLREFVVKSLPMAVENELADDVVDDDGNDENMIGIRKSCRPGPRNLAAFGDDLDQVYSVKIISFRPSKMTPMHIP